MQRNDSSHFSVREYSYMETSTFPQLLKQLRPHAVQESLWNDYMGDLEDAYCEKICKVISWADRPEECMSTIDTIPLGPNTMDRLRATLRRRVAELMPDLYDYDQARQFVATPPVRHC